MSAFGSSPIRPPTPSDGHLPQAERAGQDGRRKRRQQEQKDQRQRQEHEEVVDLSADAIKAGGGSKTPPPVQPYPGRTPRPNPPDRPHLDLNS